MRGGHLTEARQFFFFFFKSHTSNGNNINVCLLLTYLSRIEGKQSTRRLIVKQNFAETI